MFDSLYISFVIASTALILMPGPVVTLITSNTISYGLRSGLTTYGGALMGLLPMLLLVVAGMTAVLEFLAHWFEWIRWLGVAYLIYIGIKTFNAPIQDTPTITAPRALRKQMYQGCLIAITNPKTLLFFGAFFPQFIRPEGDLLIQLSVLAATFFVLCMIFDGAWILIAHKFRQILVKNNRIKNWISGSLLILTGIGLALARKS